MKVINTQNSSLLNYFPTPYALEVVEVCCFCTMEILFKIPHTGLLCTCLPDATFNDATAVAWNPWEDYLHHGNWPTRWIRARFFFRGEPAVQHLPAHPCLIGLSCVMLQAGPNIPEEVARSPWGWLFARLGASFGPTVAAVGAKLCQVGWLLESGWWRGPLRDYRVCSFHPALASLQKDKGMSTVLRKSCPDAYNSTLVQLLTKCREIREYR